jgi:hypothetical protein
MKETNLQAFISALYEAHSASESVDRYDLDSEVEASVQEWDRLLAEQQRAFRRLHEVCHRIPVDDLSSD